MKTYRIGIRSNGDISSGGRFEVSEENGKPYEIWDRDGDFPCEIIPNDSAYDLGTTFRTVYGETFKIVPELPSGPDRHLWRLNTERLVAVATIA
jgi:hypothetical protein